MASERAHPGSCGPDAGCDALCMEAALDVRNGYERAIEERDEAIAAAEQARVEREVNKKTVVHTVGGCVEGRPTHEGNYLQRLRELVRFEEERKFSCQVRTGGLSDPPQDCDWPGCGCDPYATKVLDAVEEGGALLYRPEKGERADRAARAMALLEKKYREAAREHLPDEDQGGKRCEDCALEWPCPRVAGLQLLDYERAQRLVLVEEVHRCARVAGAATAELADSVPESVRNRAADHVVWMVGLLVAERKRLRAALGESHPDEPPLVCDAEDCEEPPGWFCPCGAMRCGGPHATTDLRVGDHVHDFREPFR